MKRKFVFLIFLSLLSFQLVYSFIFPAAGYTGTGHGWLSLQDLVSHKQSPLGSSDVSIIDRISPFFSRYTINADGAVYIVLAKNFPQYYFENPIYLSRPLYSFLIAVIAFLPNLFFNSYAVFFLSAIFLNFLLALGSAWLLYLLVEKVISSRVAFLSSFLYIFSLIVHVGLVQPVAEVYGSFMIVAGLYLLYNYIKNSSYLKLIIFSLIIGIFLLGKLFAVMSIFILLLAIYFKRYKEGLLFLAVHLMPLGLWYFWVTQVFQLRFFENAVENFGAVTWMFNIFSGPWNIAFRALLDVFPKFILAAVQGFLLVPLIFAFVGFKKLFLKDKIFIYLGFIFSFLAVFFIANFYFPYHALLMFPLIFPLSVLGIDRAADFLQKYRGWYAPAFRFATIAFLVIISSVNIYKVFSY